MAAHPARRGGRICGIDVLRGFAALALVATLSCVDAATAPDPPRPTWVAVTPSAVELNSPGATEQLRAEVLDQNVQPMAGVAVTWSSSDATVATVDAQGLVTAAGNGRATITATAESAQGTAEIAVNLDRAALVTLYEATGGRDWVNNDSWLTSAPLRDWYGVQMDSDGHVTYLSLFKNNLSGTIPPEIGNLTSLQEGLSLGSNSLTGPIPPEIGNLANLQALSLSINSLSGPIPPELGNLANLQVLSLDYTSLSGPIPPEIGNLANLQALSLNNNSFTGPPPDPAGTRQPCQPGPIPPELGNLANLEDLSLHTNSLTGPIPRELGNLANLQTLWLDYTSLSGPIPRELGNLANLEELRLSNNDLTGPIPRELGNVGHFSAAYNRLTGCIPANIEPSSINPQLGGVELERCTSAHRRR